MKPINVMVMIQLDIKGIDPVNEVKDVLEAMNQIIGQSELESQPQLFISNIDESDIIEPLLDVDDKVERIKSVLREWGLPSWGEQEWDGIVYSSASKDHQRLIEAVAIDGVEVTTYVHEMVTGEDFYSFDELEEEVIDELYELIVNQYCVEREKAYNRCQD